MFVKLKHYPLRLLDLYFVLVAKKREESIGLNIITLYLVVQTL